MLGVAHKDCNLQPPATNNVPGINNLETKHNVVNLDNCAYFIYAGHQPDPQRPVFLRVSTESQKSLLAKCVPGTRYTYEYMPAEVQYSTALNVRTCTSIH